MVAGRPQSLHVFWLGIDASFARFLIKENCLFTVTGRLPPNKNLGCCEEGYARLWERKNARIEKNVSDPHNFP